MTKMEEDEEGGRDEEAWADFGFADRASPRQ
jgi:hypothetical protein